MKLVPTNKLKKLTAAESLHKLTVACDNQQLFKPQELTELISHKKVPEFEETYCGRRLNE